MPKKPKPWEQDALSKIPALPGALHAVASDPAAMVPGTVADTVIDTGETDIDTPCRSEAIDVQDSSVNVRLPGPS